MRSPFRIALAAAFVALCAASAQANGIRFPLVGDPAFLVTYPADWTVKAGATRSELIVSADRSALVALTFVDSRRDLDDVANEINSLGGPVDNTGSATISGYHGFQYDGAIATDDGVSMKVHMILVAVGENRVAAITLLTRDGIGAAELATATAVQKSATLTGAAH